MKKTVMLDVDGVLISGRPTDGKHWTTCLEADLGVSPEDLRTHFFTRYWADVQLGQTDLVPSLSEALERMGSNVSAECLAQYWFANDSRLDQDVLRGCAELRAHGYAVWLASNQDHQRADYIMSQLGLSDRFDGMIYSAALGLKKPDPAFFRAAERLSSAGPDDILFIDDTLSNVLAARACGWQAFHWTSQRSDGDGFFSCLLGKVSQ